MLSAPLHFRRRQQRQQRRRPQLFLHLLYHGEEQRQRHCNLLPKDCQVRHDLHSDGSTGEELVLDTLKAVDSKNKEITADRNKGRQVHLLDAMKQRDGYCNLQGKLYRCAQRLLL